MVIGASCSSRWSVLPGHWRGTFCSPLLSVWNGYLEMASRACHPTCSLGWCPILILFHWSCLLEKSTSFWCILFSFYPKMFCLSQAGKHSCFLGKWVCASLANLALKLSTNSKIPSVLHHLHQQLQFQSSSLCWSSVYEQNHCCSGTQHLCCTSVTLAVYMGSMRCIYLPFGHCRLSTVRFRDIVLVALMYCSTLLTFPQSSVPGIFTSTVRKTTGIWM